MLIKVSCLSVKEFLRPYLLAVFPTALELSLVSDELSHTAAAKAYFDWWGNNKHRDSDDSNNDSGMKRHFRLSMTSGNKWIMIPIKKTTVKILTIFDFTLKKMNCSIVLPTQNPVNPINKTNPILVSVNCSE
ncbi:MAG: hypothetical protein AB2L20_28865 [Mangrovibacterium sp.]